MTEEEKSDEVDGIRKQLGMLPRAVSMTAKKRGKPKSPYEADTTEEADMTEQAAAHASGDPIEIGDDNDTMDGRTISTVKTKMATTSRSIGHRGCRDVKTIRKTKNSSPKRAAMTTTKMTPMTITPNQAMASIRRRGVKEKHPQVPLGLPGKLTGQAGNHLVSERLRTFWLR